MNCKPGDLKVKIKKTVRDYIKYIELEGNPVEVREYIDEYEQKHRVDNYVRYTIDEDPRKAWIWRTLEESEKDLNKTCPEPSKGQDGQRSPTTTR